MLVAFREQSGRERSLRTQGNSLSCMNSPVFNSWKADGDEILGMDSRARLCSF